MAIQNRRGAYANFDETKMMPGEYAIVTSGDPSDADGYAVYICFASGTVRRLVFSSELSGSLSAKQDVLAFDSNPAAGSPNPVTSGGIYNALQNKQNTLVFDNTPTGASTNPVTSSGVYSALALKQNVLTFDDHPENGSSNPVTSHGLYLAFADKQNVMTYADANNDGNIVITVG